MKANRRSSNVAWILLIQGIFKVLFQFSAQNIIQNYLTKPHWFSLVLSTLQRQGRKSTTEWIGRRPGSIYCQGSCWECNGCCHAKDALPAALWEEGEVQTAGVQSPGEQFGINLVWRMVGGQLVVWVSPGTNCPLPVRPGQLPFLEVCVNQQGWAGLPRLLGQIPWPTAFSSQIWLCWLNQEKTRTNSKAWEQWVMLA